MADHARTPEDRFAEVEGWPHEPAFREWEGLRLAHVDVAPAGAPAAGGPVVLLHGEPTWGYLWRHVVDVLAAAGHRCVVPDLPGFGRSDKPEQAWFDYDRLTASVVDLLEHLDLRDVTLVCHDWGGPIGLRVATTEVPERVARIVAMDTGVFVGTPMGERWQEFAAVVAATPELDIARLVEAGTLDGLSPAARAAYAAPFAGPEHQGGAHAMPTLIPQAPDAPGAAEGQAVARALLADERPTLLLWGEGDTVLPLEVAGRGMEGLLRPDGGLRVVAGAGHFLQEDRGREVGETIAAWLAG